MHVVREVQLNIARRQKTTTVLTDTYGLCSNRERSFAIDNTPLQIRAVYLYYNTEHEKKTMIPFELFDIYKLDKTVFTV